jgi:hypothetical protein
VRGGTQARWRGESLLVNATYVSSAIGIEAYVFIGAREVHEKVMENRSILVGGFAR